jgi:hypothetical protein
VIIAWVRRRAASNVVSGRGFPARSASTVSAGRPARSAMVEWAATQYSQLFSTLAVIHTTC